MDTSTSTMPWEDIAAPTAMPPTSTSQKTKPWEDISQSSIPQAEPSGFPSPQASDNPPAGAEVPSEQRLLQNLNTMGMGYGAGQLGTMALSAPAKAIASFFETPSSLKSAGITAKTIENMAPNGQNPADYVNAVEDQFKNNGVLAKTGKETWDLMQPAMNKAGAIGSQALQTIKNEALKYQGIADPTVVDAQEALQPLADEVQKLGQGLYSKTQAASEPFQQAYDGLMNTAKQQGGNLSLDNIKSAMQETGKMMDIGGEETSNLFGKVYGKLANVFDGMVNTVSNQASALNSPAAKEAAQTLLKSNADYSTYMRVLPAVEKQAFKEAIQEGMSGYQKYIGPLAGKLAVGYGAGRILSDTVGKILGTNR